MDHGFADKYCISGCTAGNVVTPKELNGWLRETEDASGVTEVNIVIEACQSGSFLDNLEGDATNVDNSLAGEGRVVVTATGRGTMPMHLPRVRISRMPFSPALPKAAISRAASTKA